MRYTLKITIFTRYLLKRHVSDRPSGGCLFWLKQQIENVYILKFCNINNNPVLRAQFNGETFYFIPRYLNCTSWIKDFEGFENFIREFQGNNFCIVGDLNAIMGDNQILDVNLLTALPQINNTRYSKDTKVCSEGKKFFFRHQTWHE